MFQSFGILRLGGIDQPQKLMDLKALRRLGQEFLELGCCLCKLPGVVLRYGGLKLAIEFLAGGVLGSMARLTERKAKKQKNKSRN